MSKTEKSTRRHANIAALVEQVDANTAPDWRPGDADPAPLNPNAQTLMEELLVHCGAASFSELAEERLSEVIGSTELSLNLRLQAETIRQLAGLRDQLRPLAGLRGLGVES